MYYNASVGRNTINERTKSATVAIALNIKNKNKTNYSNRSAGSESAKSGVEKQQLLKID